MPPDGELLDRLVEVRQHLVDDPRRRRSWQAGGALQMRHQIVDRAARLHERWTQSITRNMRRQMFCPYSGRKWPKHGAWWGMLPKFRILYVGAWPFSKSRVWDIRSCARWRTRCPAERFWRSRYSASSTI